MTFRLPIVFFATSPLLLGLITGLLSASQSQATAKSTQPVLLKEFPPQQPEPLLGNTAILGHRLFFPATDRTSGRELWVTDGTAQGTRLVRDLALGGDRNLPNSANPWILGANSDRIFLRTDPTSTGGQMYWSSDGTATGTVPIARLNPKLGTILNTLTPEFNVHPPAFLQDSLLMPFVVQGQAHLWRTDGRQRGITQRVWTAKLKGLSPQLFTTAGNNTFFVAGDTAGIPHLWRTHGKPGGTMALAPINPAAEPFRVWQDRIYLEAETPQQGWELWTSDGTPQGTTLLRDIIPGADGSAPRLMTGLGNRFLFLANSTSGFELWATEGTPATTRRVKRLSPERSGRADRQFVVQGNRLFFSVVAPAPVRGGGYPRDGFELWVTDGSESGTQRLAHFEQGGVENLTEFKGRVYFSGGGPSGQELWVSDGTPQGTRLVRDLFPGTNTIVAPCAPPPLMIPPACPPPQEIPNGASPRSLIVQGDRLYFIANRPSSELRTLNQVSEQVLWWTDGSATGIQPVMVLDRSNRASQIVRLRGQLLVNGYEDQQGVVQLWAIPPAR